MGIVIAFSPYTSISVVNIHNLHNLRHRRLAFLHPYLVNDMRSNFPLQIVTNLCIFLLHTYPSFLLRVELYKSPSIQYDSRLTNTPLPPQESHTNLPSPTHRTLHRCFQTMAYNIYNVIVNMFRKEQRGSDRYDSDRNGKLSDFLSKQIQGRSSKNRNSRIFSNNKTGNNLNSSEIYSQPQIMKPRRGASIIRNNSKSKYAESMGKFRKDFIKESYVNFDYLEANPRKTTGKEETTYGQGINFDEEIGVEELHCQMVRLHQNVRKMQQNT